ncbi:MAG: 30S ribosomal protein S16 [Deltaproteobacteria bacterium]|nr:30S ribosomal protein S16 [Deltaproteobacteria bacterium]
MAVKLRLARQGAKKRPFYRLVVADQRAPRDGRFLEQIGFYDPTRSPAVFNVQQDRLEHWMGVGAQPTETVKRLLDKQRQAQQ